MSNGCCSPTFPQAQVPGSAGANAWAIVTPGQGLTVPAASQNLTVLVNSTAGFAKGQNVYIATGTASGANFTVYSVNSPTSLTLTDLGFNGDVATGTAIADNSLVTPGPGNVPALSTVAMTTLTQNLTLTNSPPGTPFYSSVTANVASASAFVVGQNVYIGNASGAFNGKVTALSVSGKTLTITPLGFPGDLLAGTIPSGSNVLCCTGNNPGFGTGCVTAEAYTIPGTPGDETSINISTSSVFATTNNGFTIYGILISGSYACSVAVEVNGPNSITLYSLGLPGDSPAGTVFPAGSMLIPTGTMLQIGYIPGDASDPIGTSMAVQLTAALGSGYALNSGTSATANGVVTISAIACSITLPIDGAYLLRGRAVLNSVNATFPEAGSGGSAVAYVTLKLRDTTAGADVSGTTSTFYVRASTGSAVPSATMYGNLGSVELAEAYIVNASGAAKTIQLWAVIANIASGVTGTVEVTEASILAEKIQ